MKQYVCLSAERIDAELNGKVINRTKKNIMNKNILKVAFVAAIALVGGINVFNAQKPEALSDIALANVEALADEEIGTGKWIVIVYSPNRWTCKPDGGASCPGTPW